MFDSKMLLVILAIALVIFGTKRLRTIGSDLGAAVKGFKQAMNDGESEERLKQLKQEKDAKKAKDVELTETAHILFDALGMIKADPKLAAEVLPYGGKDSTDVAVAKSATSAAPAVPTVVH